MCTAATSSSSSEYTPTSSSPSTTSKQQQQQSGDNNRKNGDDPNVTWFGYRRDLDEMFDMEATGARFRNGKDTLLGKGGYGRVYKAHLRSDPTKEYAIKCIPKTKSSLGYGATLKYQKMLKREVELHQRMSSAFHVVTLFDVFEDSTHIYLQLELCNGGSLLEHWRDMDMETADGWSEDDARDISREILQVVAQLHDRNVCFRDVKPDNFLYTTKGPDGILKLSDFGLAIDMKPGDPPYTDKCGTPAFVAPEVLHRSAGKQADVWSAGVLIYRLLSGKLPFSTADGHAKLFSSIQGDKPDFASPEWQEVSEQGRQLAQSLLQKNPSARPTAQEALQSEWMAMSRWPQRKPIADE